MTRFARVWAIRRELVRPLATVTVGLFGLYAVGMFAWHLWGTHRRWLAMAWGVAFVAAHASVVRFGQRGAA